MDQLISIIYFSCKIYKYFYVGKFIHNKCRDEYNTHTKNTIDGYVINFDDIINIDDEN
jgi:hypothetical protein